MTKKNNKSEKLALADMHVNGTRFDEKTLAALKANRKLKEEPLKKSNDTL